MTSPTVRTLFEVRLLEAALNGAGLQKQRLRATDKLDKLIRADVVGILKAKTSAFEPLPWLGRTSEFLQRELSDAGSTGEFASAITAALMSSIDSLPTKPPRQTREALAAACTYAGRPFLVHTVVSEFASRLEYMFLNSHGKFALMLLEKIIGYSESEVSSPGPNSILVPVDQRLAGLGGDDSTLRGQLLLLNAEPYRQSHSAFRRNRRYLCQWSRKSKELSRELASLATQKTESSTEHAAGRQTVRWPNGRHHDYADKARASYIHFVSKRVRAHLWAMGADAKSELEPFVAWLNAAGYDTGGRKPPSKTHDTMGAVDFDIALPNPHRQGHPKHIKAPNLVRRRSGERGEAEKIERERMREVLQCLRNPQLVKLQATLDQETSAKKSKSQLWARAKKKVRGCSGRTYYGTIWFRPYVTIVQRALVGGAGCVIFGDVAVLASALGGLVDAGWDAESIAIHVDNIGHHNHLHVNWVDKALYQQFGSISSTDAPGDNIVEGSFALVRRHGYSFMPETAGTVSLPTLDGAEEPGKGDKSQGPELPIGDVTSASSIRMWIATHVNRDRTIKLGL